MKDSLFSRILDFLLSLLGGSNTPSTPGTAPSPPTQTTLPDSEDEPAAIITNKVLMLVYNPRVDSSGLTLQEKMRWQRPEDLANLFMREILQDSHGLARYEIAERVVLDEFPLAQDGFQYDAETYLSVLRGETPPHQPSQVDYASILSRFDVLNRVARGEIDEVWVFAFPHAGFYESTMAGQGAFWCNAPSQPGTAACPRRFVIMGFSYERGLGEMLESFGHRTEAILGKAFSGLNGADNLWQRFTRYDKIAPGKAAIGTIHYAPNSEIDYDWGNPRFVPSECYDWFNFPHFQGDVRQVNAKEWGNGDITLHHRWWLQHIPHVAGRQNGIHNNWWQYTMRPEKVIT